MDISLFESRTDEAGSEDPPDAGRARDGRTDVGKTARKPVTPGSDSFSDGPCQSARAKSTTPAHA